jgi:hypothetical protein
MPSVTVDKMPTPITLILKARSVPMLAPFCRKEVVYL